MSVATIRVLPAEIAGRIAAGEVIERPASVVKELVENALDAGARRVRVDVQGGGFDLIRVGDDGIGIPGSDLWLACQRHATSKLPDDRLEQVLTLGFRGEALPSIAAVAELSLTSATDDRGVGRCLTLREGQVVRDEPAPRPRGTTVSVRHLFQNVPGRRAAAAQPRSELLKIAHLVRRLALAAPRARLALYVENRLVFESAGSGDLHSTLLDVYGPAVAGSLEPLGPIEVGAVRLRGLISGPEVTRADRAQINVVVNGRWVQPRGLVSLLEAAYRSLLPRGRHPILLLVVEVPPDEVDINIHPAKLEVRLLAERAVGQAAAELIRAALGRRPLELTRVVTGEAALAAERRVAEAEPGWDDAPIITPGLPPVRLIGQVRSRLLLLEGPAGLYLVDQHRAHERVLYERLSREHGAAEPEAVALPEPLVFELSPARAARFSRRLNELAALGFEIEVFGGRAFLLRAAPVLPGVWSGASDPLGGLGDADALAASLVELGDEDEGGEAEDWRGRLRIRLACRTAVRRGRPLDRGLMRALVESLGQTRAPAVCPHGSPLLVYVNETLLEKEFKWRFTSSPHSL